MTTTATRSELVPGPAARGHRDLAFLLFASATGIGLSQPSPLEGNPPQAPAMGPPTIRKMDMKLDSAR